jgi:transposase
MHVVNGGWFLGMHLFWWLFWLLIITSFFSLPAPVPRNKAREAEYARLSGRDRSFIKGQKYTLLSHRENLTPTGRQNLKKLLAANKRLNTAYLLKESFGQLWEYEREGWARRFFDNWRASLKWQRLEPYEKFAEMIERHWDGIRIC